RIVTIPAHDGGIAVGRDRDLGALFYVANRAGADQLAALLGPNTAAADKDPCGAGVVIVAGSSNNCGIAVAGQSNGSALKAAAGTNRTGPDQLVALLHPNAVRAFETPCGADAQIVPRPSQDGGVAVGGQRDRDPRAPAASNRII